ncbi:MAG: DUF2007 domain-containing protein [Bacteroidales bacterium]|jgi:hypothetical protein|nr:DUF2007 domain-containing protein [Bacteroidales bacterium]MBQ4021152.1 DUF2007 domain-containing protein [Bacteroidales bacterium]MBR3526618.1 DUF2007 domain-containing protein [Bacteroidales bacterium]MCR5826806.1 DUF2007 domain-containing protein [Bacteroidales bacterium]
MKVVAKYPDIYKAHIVQGLLENEGIECEIVNENLPFLGMGVAGFDVRIVVREEDYDRAKEILAANDDLN